MKKRRQSYDFRSERLFSTESRRSLTLSSCVTKTHSDCLLMLRSQQQQEPRIKIFLRATHFVFVEMRESFHSSRSLLRRRLQNTKPSSGRIERRAQQVDDNKWIFFSCRVGGYTSRWLNSRLTFWRDYKKRAKPAFEVRKKSDKRAWSWTYSRRSLFGEMYIMTKFVLI